MARSPFRKSEKSPAREYDEDEKSPVKRGRRDDRSPVDHSGRADRANPRNGRPGSSRGRGQSGSARRGYNTASSSRKSELKTPPTKRKSSNSSDNYPKRPKKLKYDSPDYTDDEEEVAPPTLTSLKDKVKTQTKLLREKEIELSRIRRKADLKEKTIQKTVDLEKRNKGLLAEIALLKDENQKHRDDKSKADRDGVNTNKKTAENLIRTRRELDEVKDSLKEKEEALKRARDGSNTNKKTAENLVRTRRDLDDARESLKSMEDNLKRVRKERDQLRNTKNKMELLEIELLNMRISKEETEDELKTREKEWLMKEKSLEDKISKLYIEDNEDEERKSNEEGTEAPKEQEENMKDSRDTSKDEDVVKHGGNKDWARVQAESQDMFNDSEVILASDDEFPDFAERIDKYEIKNFKSPKYCATKGLKGPEKYSKGIFKPTPCTLNNRVIFISAGSTTVPHKPKSNYNSFCGLSPTCSIKWTAGTYIARVCIFETVNHPKNNKEVWCCSHHNQASMDGIQLQTQAIARRHSAGSGNNPQVKDDVTKDEEEEEVTGIKALDSPIFKKDAKKESLKDRGASSNSKNGLDMSQTDPSTSETKTSPAKVTKKK